MSSPVQSIYSHILIYTHSIFHLYTDHCWLWILLLLLLLQHKIACPYNILQSSSYFRRCRFILLDWMNGTMLIVGRLMMMMMRLSFPIGHWNDHPFHNVAFYYYTFRLCECQPNTHSLTIRETPFPHVIYIHSFAFPFFCVCVCVPFPLFLLIKRQTLRFAIIKSYYAFFY